MNQVYFYEGADAHARKPPRRQCLNPFMNQVYFYTGHMIIEKVDETFMS